MSDDWISRTYRHNSAVMRLKQAIALIREAQTVARVGSSGVHLDCAENLIEVAIHEFERAQGEAL